MRRILTDNVWVLHHENAPCHISLPIAKFWLEKISCLSTTALLSAFITPLLLVFLKNRNCSKRETFWHHIRHWESQDGKAESRYFLAVRPYDSLYAMLWKNCQKLNLEAIIYEEPTYCIRWYRNFNVKHILRSVYHEPTANILNLKTKYYTQSYSILRTDL